MHIFHAGTKKLNGKIFSNGGRVLNFTMLGNSFLNIRSKRFSKKCEHLTGNMVFFLEKI